MSITNLSNTVTYIGDGSAIHFTYAFPLQLTTDMQVWITSPQGIPTQIFTNFEVDTLNTRVIYPTTGSPLPADGSKITLLRVVPLTQETVLTDTGPLPATVLEAAYDKLTMELQQFAEVLGRTLQYPVGTTPDPTDTATLLAEIEAAGANAAAAAASAAAAAASAASLGNPIPVSRGGTGSNTALVNGRFMQSAGGAIVESAFHSDSGIPSGASMDFRGTLGTMPAGWLPEDGSAYPQATFPALFAAISTVYNTQNGAADPGVGMFRVPDSRGRVNVNSGTGPGLTPRIVGQTFGEETHLLTVGEMPLHGHGLIDAGHSHPGTYAEDTGGGLSAGGGYGIFGIGGFTDRSENSLLLPRTISPSSTGVSVVAAGNSEAHNNIQPSLVALRIIKI